MLLLASLLLTAPHLELAEMYHRSCHEPTPIYQHVSVLRDLAKDCATVVEIGLYEMTSSWGLLRGLAENPAPFRSYVGIDPRRPEEATLEKAERISLSYGVAFRFVQDYDQNVGIDPAELLFIDSLHTYAHLSYELEKFSPQITRYIALHDTSAPWGEQDDDSYQGDFSEYPSWISRTKRGTWAAVCDFLARHPEWQLRERRLNCHGFTVLARRTGT